ncbi:MAG: hypothetical protein A4E70_02067 [Syntrophus sp. PtaU1.Bin005]|nr:MAG: hypothetical protein A4E70_02067 [Syntrophus sp. PtaU1.Bin005]
MPVIPQKQFPLQETTFKLLDYCRRSNWAGDDPFDGLNSRIFTNLPLLHNRISRLILTQGMKRFPINFRRLLLVPKGENPKGLAVFLSALLLLSNMGLLKNDDDIYHLIKRLIELRSPNTSHFCWGYHFDWQGRAFFLPKFVPNIICTTFAGNALLDAYAKFGDANYLNMARSAGDFLLEGLNLTKSGDEICFSYTPLDSGQVHNANLLGAAYLSRLYSITGAKKFLDPALSAVRYSTRRQNEDGSWAYGEDKTQAWVDNFHTGYNLCALRKIGQYLNTEEYEPHVRLGFEFYRTHFFREDGAPKYFHNRVYPIDIHSIAQSIITLITFIDLDANNRTLAGTIFQWAVSNMWDERGCFYYQITPYYKNKISYIRWSQAWMLLALATLLRHCNQAAAALPVSSSQIPQSLISA